MRTSTGMKGGFPRQNLPWGRWSEGCRFVRDFIPDPSLDECRVFSSSSIPASMRLTATVAAGIVAAERVHDPVHAEATSPVIQASPMRREPQDTVRAVRVLLVDDDVELCELLREAIEDHEFVVELAHDGVRGLAAALSGKHDLLLLDGMLPGLDGFEVVRQVRRQSDVPIMMLTARTAPPDQVAGLDAGADDYLTKPFGADVLLAHIRALLRRTGREPRDPEEVEVGPFRLSTGSRRVFVSHAAVSLTSIEYDILEYLARAAGRVVPRSELTTVLYQQPASPFDRGLDTHICNIRRKVGAAGGWIATVRGVGYLLRAVDPSGREN